MEKKSVIISLVILVFLILIVIWFSFGRESKVIDIKNMPAEEVKGLIKQANTHVQSYHLNVNQNFSFRINLLGESVHSSFSFALEGDIDKIKRELSLKGKGFVNAPDSNGRSVQNTAGKNVEYEITAKNSIMTIEVDGKVVESKPINDDSWNDQDWQSRSFSLLENGNFEIIGEDRYTYQLKVIPDIGELANLTNSGINRGDTEESFQQDLRKNIHNYSVELWVNKHTLLIERSLISVNVDSNVLGIYMLVDARISDVK